MILGACKITIRMSQIASLKSKRHILKKIIERTRQKFSLSIAEIGYQDEWQRAEIGFAVVGNESGHVNSILDKVLDYMEELQLAEIVHTDMEIIHL